MLCEEGCAGRPGTLVAQLIVAWGALVPAAVAAITIARDGVRRARRMLFGLALVYAAWALLLLLAT